MTVPPPEPHEGYRWPSRPAGEGGAPRGPRAPQEAKAASRLGSALAVVLVVVLLGLWAVLLDRGLVLLVLALSCGVAAGALASPRRRPFARGFLVALVCCVVLLTVALLVFASVVITGGW